MSTINRILVPTDFSPTANNAFQFALAIAECYGASIELLHVILPELAPMDFPAPSGTLMQRQTEAAEEAIQAFHDYGIAQALRHETIKEEPMALGSMIEIGTPGDVIRYVSARENIDLVILGARGQHSVVDKLLGSVSTATLNQVNLPVMIIPEHAVFSGLDKVLIAADLTEEAPYQVLEIGQLLAPFAPTYKVVHFNIETQPSSITLEEFQSLFAAPTQDMPISYHLEDINENEFSDRLNDLIGQEDNNLLVMHSPQRNWWERIFHHSLTKEMAWQTKIPLLRI